MKKQYNVGYFTSPSDKYLDDVKQALVEKGVATEDTPNSELDEVINDLSIGGLKLLFDTKKSCYYEFFNLYSLTYEQLVEIFTNPNITSSVIDMQNMFYNCNALKTIPPLDTSNVTNMQNMFYNCSSLTSIPQLDTNNVTNMNQMFVSCSKLTIIPQFNTSKVTSMTNMFYDCSSLESILMYGMSVNFNISPSTKFTRDSLVTILNNLATVTSTKKLTMGSTNLAKLTEEDKAIATNKGWTLA